MALFCLGSTDKNAKEWDREVRRVYHMLGNSHKR